MYWRNTKFAVPANAAYCGDLRRSGDQLYSIRALGASCDQARDALLAQTEGEEYLDNPPGYLCRAMCQ